jgi:uncharacterized protein (TIGR02217 family)
MFLESVRFPTDIGFNKPGGPGFNTDVAILESGFEQRNQYWDQSRGTWNIGYGVRELDKVTTVLEFFSAVKGRTHGFRYRDWNDYQSVRRTAHFVRNTISPLDQVININTTTTDRFQLMKTYYAGFLATRRFIAKPVTGTVSIAIQGVEIPSNRWDLLYVPEDKALEGHETIGRVTLAANIQKTITALTLGASTIVQTSAAHGLSLNDSVHFSNTVGGTTQIRGRRGKVTAVGDATHITVDINSTGFTAFTSGGAINTQRQAIASVLSISSISKHVAALVTTSGPHNLVPGDVGVFAAIGGMTQLNTIEATVVQVPSPTTFRVNKNSVLYSTYSGGGTFTVAERVTAGFEFDVPVRFDTDSIPMTFVSWEAAGVELPVIELRVVDDL